MKAQLKYGGRRHPSIHRSIDPVIHPFIPRVRDLINLIRDLSNPNPPLLVCLISIFSSLLETDRCLPEKEKPQKKKKGTQSSRGAPFLSVKKKTKSPPTDPAPSPVPPPRNVL